MVGSNAFSQRLLKLWIPLLLYSVFLLFPFAWMLIVSIKPDQALLDTRLNPFAIVQPTLEHYRFLLQETAFPRWIKNTLIVTIGATALALFCSILIGYALGRFRFRGGNTLGIAIFLLYLVPPALLFIPLSQIIARFGLYNSYWSLILTYPTFLIPFASWLLMGYFRTISRELEDAALVDGATRLQAMTRIVLPLAIPGVLSAGIFCFTLGWNEFLYALVFMGSGDMKTVPVGVVSDFIRADVYFWGVLMAAAIAGSVPVAVAYAFLVDNYVSGLTAGATKG
jgi:multiple sugar transport system permease protein